jgi:hypothetical protein
MQPFCVSIAVSQALKEDALIGPTINTSALQGASRLWQTGPLGPGVAGTRFIVDTSVANLSAVAASPEAKAIRLPQTGSPVKRG